MPLTAEQRNLPYFQRPCLIVRNLEKSFELYQDLLGFRVEYVGIDSPDSYSYDIFKIPKTTQTRFATLSSADQQRTLALIEVPDFEGKADTLLDSAIVIQVADVNGILFDVQKRGLVCCEPHLAVGPPARTEAGFYDSDGHLVVIYELGLPVNLTKQAKPDTEPLPKSMKQWTLRSRPQGLAKVSDFELKTVPLPNITDGQLLVQTQYLGVAPVMLRYMNNETSFERPMAIGDVMIGRGVGKVVVSKHPNYKVGDYIQAKLGWREYAMVDGNESYYLIHKMQNTDLPISHGISTLAMSGFTGLIGLRDICKVKAGDRVLVSGAAGGVGSQLAYIAKALGATQVVGIAGGSKKCEILTQKLNYTASIDYKNDDVSQKLTEFFPDGIDVFFDNVGGEILDEVMGRIRRRGRIAICGRISEYLKPVEQYHRHQNLWRIGLQDAKLEAFFIYDYTAHFTEYEKQLAEWIRAGKLTPCEDILNGIERTPEALIGLYNGDNVGVKMVRVTSN